MGLEGIADLPLHTGKVPYWLASIMRRLSKAIIDVMIIEWGPDKVVERLSNPLWFQGFNNIIGMDWDSSGSTTVTLGILKEVIKPEEEGIAVLGGKGKNALKVPDELNSLRGKFSVNLEKIERASRLVAKVDSTLIQDGHTLYHHSVLVSESGKWGIIQQGMNLETRFARRYHWLSTENFLVEPHKGIMGVKQEIAINAVDKNVENTRKLMVDLLKEPPEKLINDVVKAENMIKGQTTLDNPSAFKVDIKKRRIYMKPIEISKIRQILHKVYEVNPSNLEEALLHGLGPSSTRALYLVADLIYNEPPSYNDPVNMPYDPFKYAYAIGGKDGIPFPVNRKVAYEVIYTLEDILQRIKTEEKDREFALRKLRSLAEGLKE
ncbi:DUF763 domain-containing protein [Sulfolobus acidocaldarius]|uniref:Conserved protein n=4 Tax=Sulfolobus acidocaldarius TaxID=2285 RepID=Q4JBZ6_SULAC|nr:DUF763 domain-containing protein [Sulfolobus acidocaldarius]AAY79683.1 conserved protein [Sulfolobus acidocaldarius DSM 639]AGE70242.1 hypothetical protein SacN8_01305 [Sulfolobus acidocaldarius N8]AGE72517.1 hypothetical protein SacRon12I_01305 [Sulfolobus acidocaldarius Ron12/I]ALU29353.1 hypothetical protein ATY89_04945 [Sulfolobus acidocaldarius]ALU32082.1 hypothetical protein ATZ20_07970 [Sulfolobus acidocaldarius]